MNREGMAYVYALITVLVFLPWAILILMLIAMYL